MDIKGYFMSIDRNLLFKTVYNTLTKYCKKVNFDLPLILDLIKQIIYNDPTKNYILKGNKRDWKDLPPSKSLFHSVKNTGLPIGNLTSQLFSNVYLNPFDHFVKKELGIKYYGRYVDDFIIIHPDKTYLKMIIPVIKNYLKSNLMLDLHPKKVYFQHYLKGVKFLGTVIKTYRIYTDKRTKGNFYKTIQQYNNLIKDKKKLSKEEQKMFMSSINSYLGILKHYKTYKLRKKMLINDLSSYYWNYFYISGGYSKLVFKIKMHKV